MTLDSAFHAFSVIFQVFLLDLILSGDNAVVIALSCRSLPPRQMNQAMLLGTGAAIGLRVVLTALVSIVLRIPTLKLIGAVLLIVIAIRLLIEEERAGRPADEGAPSGLWNAVITVVAADLVMSLDNVVALAAVTQGSILYLILGLVLSVALLMFSSKLMINLLQRYPLLIPAAGALLGYIAGNIGVSDHAIADWVNTQSPALTGLVPLLCAVFVVAESRIIQRRRDQLPRRVKLKARPTPTPAPAPAPAPTKSLTTVARDPEAGMANATPSSLQMAASQADELLEHPKTAPQPLGQEDTKKESGQDLGSIAEPQESRAAPRSSVAAPKEHQENVPPANYFGLGRLIGNPFIQVTVSIILALFCIIYLPKTWDIFILIGITLLMLLKIF